MSKNKKKTTTKMPPRPKVTAPERRPTLINRSTILAQSHKGNMLYTVAVNEPDGYRLIAGSVALNGGCVRDFAIVRSPDDETVGVKYRPVGSIMLQHAVFTGHFQLVKP